MDKLPLLKDIHLPDPIWGFPMGYGIFMIMIMPVVIYFMYKLFKFIYAKSKKYYALNLLKKARQNNVQSVIKISEILRRVCLYKYKDAVSLFGNEWIEFLNKHCKQQIKGQAAELLVYAPYIQKNMQYDQKIYKMIRKYVKHWIGENL